MIFCVLTVVITLLVASEVCSKKTPIKTTSGPLPDANPLISHFVNLFHERTMSKVPGASKLPGASSLALKSLPVSLARLGLEQTYTKIEYKTVTNTVDGDKSVAQWALPTFCGFPFVKFGDRKFTTFLSAPGDSPVLTYQFGPYNGCFELHDYDSQIGFYPKGNFQGLDLTTACGGEECIRFGRQVVLNDKRVPAVQCYGKKYGFASSSCEISQGDYSFSGNAITNSDYCPFDYTETVDAECEYATNIANTVSASIFYKKVINYEDSLPEMSIPGVSYLTTVYYASTDCSEDTEISFRSYAIETCLTYASTEREDIQNGHNKVIIHNDGTFNLYPYNEIRDDDDDIGTECVYSDAIPKSSTQDDGFTVNNEFFSKSLFGPNTKVDFCQSDALGFSFKTTITLVDIPKSEDHLSLTEEVSLSALVLGVTLGTVAVFAYLYSVCFNSVVYTKAPHDGQIEMTQA